MKKIIFGVIVLSVILVGVSVDAAKKGDETKIWGIGGGNAKVYKLEDGKVTCYISMVGTGSSISCLK